MVIKRRLYGAILRALKRQAAVLLTGPRQVGKTTLALEVARDFEALYVDLELPSSRRQLSEPELFLQHNGDKLVVLDEVQHAPELFQVLRSQIDVRRGQQRRTGHFLILGSAAISLLRQSSESLAGRIEHLQLDALDVLEVAAYHQSQASAPSSVAATAGAQSSVVGPSADGGSGQVTVHKVLSLSQPTLWEHNLWVRGGLPDSYLAATDDDSFVFRQNFIQTYLKREIKQFSPQVPDASLERLWIMLAHQQGGVLNVSQLAKALALSSPTVARYMDLLEALFLIYKLPPYFKSIKKRLVKSPKLYVRNSGIVHALLGLQNYNKILEHPVAGLSWEGFVIDNILSLSQPAFVPASFYRTQSGAEVDLLLEWPNDQPWPIEIKREGHPRRGFYEAVKDLEAEQAFVINAGEMDYQVSPQLRCMGLLPFMQHLKKHIEKL